MCAFPQTCPLLPPPLNWSEIWSARPSNIDNEEWYVHCKYYTVYVCWRGEGGGNSVVIDAIAIHNVHVYIVHVHISTVCSPVHIACLVGASCFFPIFYPLSKTQNGTTTPEPLEAVPFRKHTRAISNSNRTSYYEAVSSLRLFGAYKNTHKHVYNL